MSTNPTITEFLEARIAEDERKAEAGGYHNSGEVFANDNYGCLLVQPSRVLAECAAKRAILAYFSVEAEKLEDPRARQAATDPEWWLLKAAESTLRSLAAVYKDHPDYRQEWVL